MARRLILLLLSLIAPVLASADATADAFVIARPDTYPAVGFQGRPLRPGPKSALSKALARNKLYRGVQLLEPEDRRRLEPFLSRSAVKTWRRAAPHPYLDGVLPGVTFYSVTCAAAGPRRSGREPELLVGVRDSTCWVMPYELSRMLQASGAGFRPAGIGTWMRTAALVWAAVSRRELMALGLREVDALLAETLCWQRPLFPGIVVDSAYLDLETDGLHDPAFLRLRLDTLPPVELTIGHVRYDGPYNILPYYIAERRYTGQKYRLNLP